MTIHKSNKKLSYTQSRKNGSYTHINDEENINDDDGKHKNIKKSDSSKRRPIRNWTNAVRSGNYFDLDE